MKTLKLCGLLFLLAPVTACGYLFGDKGLFRDSAGDYREAREMPPINLPQGTSSDEFVDTERARFCAKTGNWHASQGNAYLVYGPAAGPRLGGAAAGQAHNGA
ncbi:hypothetical protein N9H37_03640 [Congregibacter sp.]|nr:hypothetical protein [Congregibacter sp.]MDA8962428.1 hypothetical protein [Congregibacter sp.]